MTTLSGVGILGLVTSFVLAMAFPSDSASELPILFVHGNGDSAALWHTTIWRFETNGYPRDRLIAIDMDHPTAPSDDTVPEENRGSTTEQAARLSAEVARVLLQTGQKQVILIGSSRGGNTIRNYIKRTGGWANVKIAILCGTPNHGITARGDDLNSEWNGRGHFLGDLNKDSEVHPEVRFVTLRSDRNDKYAQPTADALGLVSIPTGVDFNSPALRGGENIVLAGRDHREVAFHPDAFREQFRVITGKKPKTLKIHGEPNPILSGMVSGFGNGAPTNLPLEGARIEIFQVAPETGARLGSAVYESKTLSDGRWGPFVADSETFYEFVVHQRDYPITHVYRSPFPRSSRYVHFRLSPAETQSPTGESREGAGLVIMSRPRGYYGDGRDRFTLNETVPEGVAKGVPQTSIVQGWFSATPPQSIRAVFNDESIVVRTFPFVEHHLVIAEFHY